MNDGIGVRAAKRRLRSAMRARRESLRPDQRRSGSAAIRRRLCRLPALCQARVIFIYVSGGAEVRTDALIRSLLRQRRTVCVPRIVTVGSMRAVAIRRWSDLTVGCYGIPAPRSTKPRRNVDVAVVPGLAFGVGGERLGAGAGYYDRWFAAFPQAWRIAVAYEAQITRSVPMTAHDRRMHAIVTEKRVIRVRTGEPRRLP